jgi:hypothetical protein
MHPVPQQRQSNRLRADTARTIQDRVRPRSKGIANDPVERRGLPTHRPLPIGKDQVVLLSQRVIKRPYVVIHVRIIRL